MRTIVAHTAVLILPAAAAAVIFAMAPKQSAALEIAGIRKGFSSLDAISRPFRFEPGDERFQRVDPHHAAPADAKRMQAAS
jgi:hypothetical protein